MDLTGVKAVIRSILISDSSKNGLSVDKLCKDYRNIEGNLNSNKKQILEKMRFALF
jgi:hypothetical protein